MERRTRRRPRTRWLQLGQIAGAVGGAVVGRELGGYIAEGTQFGLGTLLLRYSRDYELRQSTQ